MGHKEDYLVLGMLSAPIGGKGLYSRVFFEMRPF